MSQIQMNSCTEIKKIPDMCCPQVVGELQYPIKSLPVYSTVLPSLNSISTTYAFNNNEINSLAANPEVYDITEHGVEPSGDLSNTAVKVQCADSDKRVASVGAKYVSWLNSAESLSAGRLWIPRPVDFCIGKPLILPTFWRKPIAGAVSVPTGAPLLSSYVQSSRSTTGIIDGFASRSVVVKYKSGKVDWDDDDEVFDIDEDDSVWDDMNSEIDDAIASGTQASIKLCLIYKYRYVVEEPYDAEEDGRADDYRLVTYSDSGRKILTHHEGYGDRWSLPDGENSWDSRYTVRRNIAVGGSGGCSKNTNWSSAVSVVGLGGGKKCGGVCGSYGCDTGYDIVPWKDVLECADDSNCYGNIRVFKL